MNNSAFQSGSAAVRGNSPPDGASKRRTHKLFITLIVLILLVALAVCVFMVLQFDMLGLKTKFFDYARSLDPAYGSVQAAEENLARRESLLAEREAELKSESDRLDSLSSKLAEREAAVSEREADLKSQKGLPVYRRPIELMSEREVEDMKNLSAAYEKMPPDTAAYIISRLNSTEDMAALLYFMTPEAAAKIFSALEPSVAADVTNKLLRY
jgi:flagellar motility protein MotE (MotC chaperone)